MLVGRTSIVIDDCLMRRVIRQYGFRTKREAVDYALRQLVSPYTPRDILDLEGAGWEGNLDQLRRTRFPDILS